ncbi:MAG: protein-glutamate O-methyltransferase CheR [Polyangiaceae bacterium]|nr:protein-glutamate O-methyltransferase CheR [Polyangiaceae bacterium]
MSSTRNIVTYRRLRAEEFRLLRDLVNERFGLHFDDEAVLSFERRLGERVIALDLAGFEDYYSYLRFNPNGAAELEETVEALTTNETYFFRQEYQLRCFRNEVLSRLADENRVRRRLAIWSAGCSTGEEAYTIAMLVHESGLFSGWDVRVVGSDISRRSIAIARRGIYRGASFRAIPAAVRGEYFYETPEGDQVVDYIRKMCHFGQLNLLDGARAAIVGRVDAVFCRNVLIYFDSRSRRQVIDNLYERLVPGGYLMLGHSESLLNVSTAFELVHLREDLVYRKPPAAQRIDPSRSR